MKEFYVNDFDRLRNRRYEGDNYDKILSQPAAFWYGWGRYDKHKLDGSSVNRLLRRAGNKLVTLVLYNITNRDKNHYSKGGARTEEAYKQYVDDFCSAIDRECIVIVEPDALAHARDYLRGDDRKMRLDCLSYAVSNLYKTPARIYLDIGHSGWFSAYTASSLLKEIDFPNSKFGFSVNVSNFNSTQECIDWADKISAQTSRMHYVIDTSRNGAEVEGWCNPPGAKLGQHPTFETDSKVCDAYLWIKIPGESDGKDGTGAPHAGKFYDDYARKLIE